MRGFFVIGTVIPNDPVPVDFPADRFEKVVVDLMSEEILKNLFEGIVAKHNRIDARS
jgi:hypothetical protein